jgi:hypothetical protein
LNRYDGAISQCIGKFRTGALTLEPIGPGFPNQGD